MTVPRSYWGGDKVSPATIYRLPATSFKELVALFSVPYVIKARRSEYHTWDKKQQGQAKDGPYILPCTFKEGTELRSDKDAEEIVAICLDIDDPALARPFAESPQTIADALWPYAHAAWTTASSTPENPHLRIVVPCEPVPAVKEALVKRVRHLARLMGLPKDFSGHRESGVLSQPAYRPAVFEGEDTSPVISIRADGQLLSELDIPDEIDEEVRQLYAYQGECNDELDNLPIPGLKPEDIREPLSRIDPDVPYAQWCKVACGLRHNFRDEESAEEAFHLFDEWSQKGSKYRDGDTLAKWISFKPDFGSQRPTTIKTLFEYAKAAGWEPVRIIAKYKESFKQWLAGCDDPDVLTQEGPRRIAMVPFKSPLVEDQMKQALKKRINDTGGGNLSLIAISASVSKARGAVKAEEIKGNKPPWILPWCYVRTIHKFYNSITGVLLAPEAFNLSYAKELKPVNPEDEAIRNGKPPVMPVDFMLTIHEHEQVDRIAYDPRKGSATNPYFTAYGQRFVNEYRHSTVPAEDEKNARKVEKAIRMHLNNLFPNDPETVEAIIDWMAFLVQYPGVKIRWVPAIIGAQGSGKTFLASFVAAALGEPNVGEANSGTIKQGWNDWAVGYQLVKIEELWVAGKGRSEIYNAMKDILTNDFVVVNRRARDPYKVEHVTNYVAFSNHFDILPLEESDRRWWILQSGIRTEQQVLELTESTVAGMPYFDYLGKLLLTGGGAIRAWLKSHKIRPSFQPNGHAPKTEARYQLIESAKNPLQQAIEETVRAGECPMIGEDLIHYETLAGQMGGLLRNNHAPSHYLYKLGYMPHLGNQRFAVNGTGRSQVWVHAENYDADMFGDPVEEIRRRYFAVKEDSI